MENYSLKNDLKVFCVTAKSFPDGILQAFLTLEKMLPSIEDRTFFGLSYMKDGTIVYKAAVLESYEGEGEKNGCETFTIKKGEYLTETIVNWRESIERIGYAFETLLADPRLDTTFPCVEWYKDPDVMCMIRMDNVKFGKPSIPAEA
jgi:hypothetical protein